jgi:hypothetical protein
MGSLSRRKVRSDTTAPRSPTRRSPGSPRSSAERALRSSFAGTFSTATSRSRKSSKPERMTENLDVLDFELSRDDMESIDALDKRRE